MNLFDLRGKRVLLVGYKGNLGPIWMDALWEAGAAVFPFGLPEEDLSSTEYEYLGNLPDIVPDIIVCNAAIDIPPNVVVARFFTDFMKIIQVNLIAHARIIDYYLPDMIKAKTGVIVLIGSIQGYVGADWRNYTGGFEKPIAYNLSKAALQQLARSLTVQYGRYGIRAACPGFGPVATKKLSAEFVKKISQKIPTHRLISEKSLKQTLLYACCCEDLAGEDWLVDGGYTKW